MGFKIAIALMPLLSLALSGPPVFLERGGSKICTLNNIGKVPAGGPAYRPVYQKVCRAVIPTMGDPVEDEEAQASQDEVQSDISEDDADIVRRAIMSPKQKVEESSGAEKPANSKVTIELNPTREELKFNVPKSVYDLTEPIRFKTNVIISN